MRNLLLIFIFSTTGLIAQNLDMAFTIGDNIATDYGWDVESDAQGNFVIGGQFFSTIDLDHSAGQYVIGSGNGYTGYVAKYDAQGNILWGHELGGPDIQIVRSVTVDSQDNVYVGGAYKGSLDGDGPGGIAPLQSNGFYDFFVAKYSPSGTLLWVHGFGGSGEDYLRDVMVDANDDVFIAGRYTSTFDADPGPGIANCYFGGGFDGFIIKFDANGNFLHRTYIQGLNTDEVVNLATDGNGNVIASGQHGDGADFMVAGSYILNAANIDAFVAKYDTDLQLIWAYNIGGGASVGTNTSCEGMHVNQDGTFVLAGSYWGPADFDPIGSTPTFTPPVGSGSMYIAKYAADASLVWMKEAATGWNSQIWALEGDGQGNVISAGFFRGTTDFDPNMSTYILDSPVNRMPFLWSLNDNGDLRFAHKLHTNNDAGIICGLDLQGGSTLTATGAFADTLQTDLFGSSGQLTSVIPGITDMFFARYDISGIPTGLSTNSGLEGVSVSPNPSSDQVLISFPDGIFELRIFDVSGKLVLADRGNSSRVSWDATNERAGIYQLVLNIDGKAHTQKISIY